MLIPIVEVQVIQLFIQVDIHYQEGLTRDHLALGVLAIDLDFVGEFWLAFALGYWVVCVLLPTGKELILISAHLPALEHAGYCLVDIGDIPE